MIFSEVNILEGNLRKSQIQFTSQLLAPVEWIFIRSLLQSLVDHYFS